MKAFSVRYSLSTGREPEVVKFIFPLRESTFHVPWHTRTRRMMVQGTHRKHPSKMSGARMYATRSCVDRFCFRSKPPKDKKRLCPRSPQWDDCSEPAATSLFDDRRRGHQSGDSLCILILCVQYLRSTCRPVEHQTVPP